MTSPSDRLVPASHDALEAEARAAVQRLGLEGELRRLRRWLEEEIEALEEEG